MSFGFSLSDLTTLGRAVKRAYDGWKHAPADLQDVASQLQDFQTIVKRLKDAGVSARDRGERDHSSSDREDCLAVLQGCSATVRSLERIVEARGDRTSSKKQHWNRFRLGLQRDEIAKLQARLTAHQVSLSMILTEMSEGAIRRVEQKQSLLLRGEEEKFEREKEQLVKTANQERTLDKIFDLVQGLHARLMAEKEYEDHQRKAMGKVIDTDKPPTPSDNPRTLSIMKHSNIDGDGVTTGQQHKLEPEHADLSHMEDDWNRLRRELLDMGFDLTLLREHGERIKTFFMGLHLRYARADPQREARDAETRREDRFADEASRGKIPNYFDMPWLPPTSNAAMSLLSRRARDLQASSYAATDGSARRKSDFSSLDDGEDRLHSSSFWQAKEANEVLNHSDIERGEMSPDDLLESEHVGCSDTDND